MTHATIATRMPTTCLSSCTASPPKHERRAHRRFGARLAALALAVAALVLMYEGERSLLERSLAIPDELTVAACAIDVVHSDADASNACTSTGIR